MKLALNHWQDESDPLVLPTCLIRRPYRRAVWKWRDRFDSRSRPMPWFLNTIMVGWTIRPAGDITQPAHGQHRLILQELLR